MSDAKPFDQPPAPYDTAINFYERDFYPFSNFSSFRIRAFGEMFNTSEELYHWCKFLDAKDRPGSRAIQEQIRTTASAHDSFLVANRNRAHYHPHWNVVKLDVMYWIIARKASQHEYVMHKLRQSGDRVLVEGSWRDGYWGCGPDGTGHNHLGKLWMQLRDELLHGTNMRMLPNVPGTWIGGGSLLDSWQTHEQLAYYLENFKTA